MSPTGTIFLVRHGETDWNAAGRWQGQTDVPLNARGRTQALALAERMRSEGIEAIASSDLVRASTTARIIGEALRLPIHVDPGLREQSFGLFEGLTRAECERRFPEEWERYSAGWRVTPPGGESLEALLARLVPAIQHVVERLASPALVVMHGGAMRALLRERADSAVDRWPMYAIPNGGTFRVRFGSCRILEVSSVDLDPV
jgi:probable phosphoglycerate mutase